GMVCVVGRMRDLILQLSKSSIYSTKPLRPYSSHTVMTTDSARLYQLNYIDDDGAVVAIPLQAAYAPAPR
ncbi:hypothetical protein RAF64_17420, partial [Klebsiella quasipneumoniae subsp. similipneumoniae]